MPGTSTGRGRYCELHAHSCFSLLDGVPFPGELAERAAGLGLVAIALTDLEALFGVVPFFSQARTSGIHAIAGAELTLDDGAHLTLLAASQAGYRNLSTLITFSRTDKPKGTASLSLAEVAPLADGLICLTGCRRGRVASRLLARDYVGAQAVLDDLLTIFGRPNVYVEVQRNLRRDDIRLSRRLADLAAANSLPVVATGNVHYLTRRDAELQDVLVSVREHAPLGTRPAAAVLRPNHEYYLRSPAAVLALYPDLPQAVTNTLAVAERCAAAPPSGLQTLPAYPTPAGLNAVGYLRALCAPALAALYPRQLGLARDLLEKELGLIDRLGLANYFLIVWDIVRFCREHGILCHGRGSAANSLVARLLGISAVDPIAQGLVIERFLSVEHGGTPDIDLDIDSARRETVIQYVYERWGRNHAAMACTYITYRSAGALRDAGYALGFRPEALDAVAATLESPSPMGAEASTSEGDVTSLAAPPVGVSSLEWQRLLSLTERMRRRPRHLGIHNGGMIVTGEPIAGLMPVEPAAMDARTVVQWDKAALEEAGIVKIDLLGLRMLSAIADAIALVRERGHVIDLHRLDTRNPRVYDQICSAHTIGIFQVESGAQVSIIPQMQPRCFQDLVVEVSLIRPGPLQGNMVRPYIRRRLGQEPVRYAHPLLKPALESTLGVIVFQEQVIKIARDFAGFPAGRGELLRRALSGKDSAEALERFHDEFVAGAVTQGAPAETAEQVWQSLRGFAGYSFSQAHAAAFAMIVFWSAWLRVHFPAEYFCGLLRHAPLGTYPANVLEAEARRVGVKFLSFDINRSPALPDMEQGAIRFGLGYVKGIGAEQAAAIIEARGGRPFKSLVDFIQRTGLDRRPIEALILAGAFDRLGERRQVLWSLAEAFALASRPHPVRRLQRRGCPGPTLPLEFPDEQAQMRPLTAEQRVVATFAQTGVTAGPHLAALKGDAFAAAGCLPYRELLKLHGGARVKLGGLVADGLRRPPTAKGTGFIRLEMPEGLVDVVIPLEVYARCRPALRSAFVIVEGRLQRNRSVLSVMAATVTAL